MSIMSAIKKFFGFFICETPETHNTQKECYPEEEDCYADTYIGNRIGNSEYYVIVSCWNFYNTLNQDVYEVQVEVDIRHLPHFSNEIIPIDSRSTVENVPKETFDICPDEAYNSILSELLTRIKEYFKQTPDGSSVVELLESYELYIQDDMLKIEKR